MTLNTFVMDSLNQWDRETTIPRVYTPLYHYTSANGLMGIIEKEGLKFWFSNANYLNDTSEGKDVLDLYRQACDQLRSTKEISHDFYQFAYQIEPKQTMLHKVSSLNSGTYANCDCDIYMCCFSTQADSLPMWNYYVKDSKYQGYNIGISVTSFKQNSEITWAEVIYSDELKIKKIKEFLLSISEFYGNADQVEIKSSVEVMQERWQYAFKSHYFEHEREIRAILKIPKTGSDQYPVKFHVNSGILIPHVEYCFSGIRAQQITIGPLIDGETAKKSIAEYLVSCGYPEMHNRIVLSKAPIRY